MCLGIARCFNLGRELKVVNKQKLQVLLHSFTSGFAMPFKFLALFTVN